MTTVYGLTTLLNELNELQVKDSLSYEISVVKRAIELSHLYDDGGYETARELIDVAAKELG